jgi:hypothetical protein
MRMVDIARALAFGLACLLAAAAGGCNESAPAVLSPTPEQDPDRYEHVRRAEEQAKHRNQEAERILMKKRRTTFPVK